MTTQQKNKDFTKIIVSSSIILNRYNFRFGNETVSHWVVHICGLPNI
jgi:hypothetical protein